MDRTLVICKPDAVERGLVGEIVARLERKQLRIVAMELRRIDEATAGRHYAEHEGKPFYGDLAIELIENLVHGSDSQESAKREIDIFFPGR